MNASVEKIDRTSWKPVLLKTERNAKQAISAFASKTPGIGIIDQYAGLLEGVFLLRHPQYRFNKEYGDVFVQFQKEHAGGKSLLECGSWFYFPWLNHIVHFLPEDMHCELRTGRNRNLITKGEQDGFYRATVGVLGMSVGSHVAVLIAMTGGGRCIKLADPDSISGDNLNRIRTGFQNVGVHKAIAVARQIFEINPYAEVEIFSDGLREETMDAFLGGNHALDLLVEEMDDPYLKIAVRLDAKKRGIPVLMAADNGDGNIVDIERYDLNRNYPILHGIMGNADLEQLKALAPQELPKVIAKIAGANRAVPRMLESVPEVGKTIYSWPQLGTAANMCGSVIAMLARRIVNKDQNIKSGRYSVNMDAIFESDYKRKWFSRKIAFLKFVRKMMRQ